MGTIDDMGIKPNMRPEVAIHMGRKGPNGGVDKKDRFWLTYAQPRGKGMKAVSELHPSFALFNYDREAVEARRAKLADEQPRPVNNAPFRILQGVLIHAEWEQAERFSGGCIDTRFVAQKLPNIGQTPANHPACVGNGRTARRWDGKVFRDIPCPGEACEFRQQPKNANDPMPCKRSSTLVLQLRWPSGPCPSCRGRAPAVAECDDCDRTGKVDRTFPSSTAQITSGGPWSYATMQWWGFYEQIVKQFHALGGEGAPNLYGLPVRLVLTYTTIPTRASATWVPQLYTDFEPGQTLQGWLLAKRDARHQLGDELHGQLQLAGPVMGAREVVEAAYDDVPDAQYELPDERGSK